eukprot:CAMPEP_0116089564 /NCGR_PEP_ID=MMETSP0327-20121206/6491_1 /TAXON_ID=44447 /ORGANISM="Pseudo-nitzschia delicatissima, Strain B596" /LENGTH=378 /DNA_ID=CAMNT_0003580761 /DNA_START=13 /DNA_END=1147 /DNA_ORIENTATION=-
MTKSIRQKGNDEVNNEDNKRTCPSEDIYEDKIFSSSLFHCGIFCHLRSLRIGSDDNFDDDDDKIKYYHAVSRILPNICVMHAVAWLEKTVSDGASRLYMSNNSQEKVSKKKANKKDKSLFRADRVLSNRGWGSRSECFDLLKKKRVFQEIDSEMQCISGPKQKIPMDAALFVDGKKEVPKPPPLLRVFHKPKWMLSVMNDSKGRSNLSDLDEKLISMMHPVGRLDYDSSGLLLFSSDGKLTQKLLHPSNEVEKEYVALVVGKVDEDTLREKLAGGVQTSDGTFPATLLDTKFVPDNEVKPIIHDIIDNLPEEYDLEQLEKNGHLHFKNATEMSEVRLVVEEGKHRMVRRILANSGYPVIGLKRHRLGPIELDEDLLPG